MSRLETLRRFFTVEAETPELALSQLRAFSRQVPLLYAVLIINAAFVSATHYALAPWTLTLLAPVGFTLGAIVRIFGWWRLRHIAVGADEAAKRLRSTVNLAGLFGAALVGWSFALLPYGGLLQQAHVAFFMAITMIACVFCLMHLRAAAFLLTLIVVIPFAIRFASMGNGVLLAMALNLALVSVAMLIILWTHSKDFSTMVAQKLDLENTNRQTQRLSDENYRLANLDSLTGLPNRRSFFASIDLRIAENGPDRAFAVGIIDMDGFKAVNDLHGHAAGDALLIEAACRMRGATAGRAQFARLGGDEFGLIASPEDALSLAQSVCDALRVPYEIDGAAAEIGASCGLALFPDNGASANEIMEFADYALYQAKHEKPGEALLFSASHRDELRAAHRVDQALRNQQLERELHLVYQPVVEVGSGTIVSVEALARWNSGVLGDVQPAEFIGTAERSQVINRMTVMLLKRLLAEMREWPAAMTASLNLSSRCLASPETMLQIVTAIRSHGIDPRRIEFEVTETAVMIDFDGALRSLMMLRNIGASIALDDFGTGYSSLSYVHQLPLDKIKIDRRFVAGMAGDKRARSIVKTIIGLSRDLELKCVAEGVETETQARMLEAAGCAFMQGFHFFEPVGPAEITAQLRAQSRAEVKTSA